MTASRCTKLKTCEIYVFWKNDPLRENFKNSVTKVLIASPIDMLCTNFVKFGRRKIGLRYLPDKKIRRKVFPIFR